jgi:hypothetical protein
MREKLKDSKGRWSWSLYILLGGLCINKNKTTTKYYLFISLFFSDYPLTSTQAQNTKTKA